MSTELQMLVWSVVLGLAQIMIAATLGTMQRGWHGIPVHATKLCRH